MFPPRGPIVTSLAAPAERGPCSPRSFFIRSGSGSSFPILGTIFICEPIPVVRGQISNCLDPDPKPTSEPGDEVSPSLLPEMEVVVVGDPQRNTGVHCQVRRKCVQCGQKYPGPYEDLCNLALPFPPTRLLPAPSLISLQASLLDSVLQPRPAAYSFLKTPCSHIRCPGLCTV